MPELTLAIGATGSPWPEIEYYSALGLGLCFGLIVASILHIGWVFLGGPVQEWVAERTLDPWRKRQAQHKRPAAAVSPGAAVAGPYRILVSDLHIDTWNEDDAPERPERVNQFITFVAAIAQEVRVADVFLNGDLMDFPLNPVHQGHLEPTTLRVGEALTAELQQASYVTRQAWAADAEQTLSGAALYAQAWGVRSPGASLSLSEQQAWQGVWPERLDLILQPLANLVATRQLKLQQRSSEDAANPFWPLALYYFTGNHDIGISGLRFFRPDQTSFGLQAVWNPSGLIETPRQIYLEHGHLYDPLLWLYMRYAFLDLFRGSHQREQSFFARMQRHGQVGMKKTQPVAAPVSGTPPPAAAEATAAEAAEVAEVAAAPLPPRPRSFGEWIVVYRYRHAARMAFDKLRRAGYHDVFTVSFGHTHLEDVYDFPGGLRYINSGSWAGATADQTFWVIQPDGTVTGPHQWQAEDLDSPADPLHLQCALRAGETCRNII